MCNFVGLVYMFFRLLVHTYRSVEVEVKSPKGKVYSLVINDLFEDIQPEHSYARVCTHCCTHSIM